MTWTLDGYGKTTSGLHHDKGPECNLVDRCHQQSCRQDVLHREHIVEGFTKRYGIGKLVWFELHGDMFSAIAREKQIKKWNRAWKVRLIEEKNPYWNDLWDEITGQSKVAGFPPSRG